MAEYVNPLKRHVEPPPAPPVEKPKRMQKKKEVAVVEKPTRTALVRPSFGAMPMEVEIPTVESRFATAFREPTTDNPGLVIDDSGNVYLVNPDGTRTLLSGGGGGGSFPTFFQLDEPGSPADGDTWMRPAGAYPDQFAVGAFRWNTDAGSQPIGTVALNDDGSVHGIISVGQDTGTILAEAHQSNGDPGSVLFITSDSINFQAHLGASAVFDSGVSLNGATVIQGNDPHESTVLSISQNPAAYADSDQIIQVLNGHGPQQAVFTLGSQGQANFYPQAGNTLAVFYPDDSLAFAAGHDAGGVEIDLLDTGGAFTVRDQAVGTPLLQMNELGMLSLAPKASSGVDALVALYDDDSPVLQVGSDSLGVAAFLSDGFAFTVQAVGFGNAIQIQNDATVPKFGFYGASPVAQPVVPNTTPAVQDVINALVALGLVVQHD